VAVDYKGLTVPESTDLADGPRAFREYTDDLPTSDALLAVEAKMMYRVFPNKAAMDAWAAPVGALAWAGILWHRVASAWSPYRLTGRCAAPAVGVTKQVMFDAPFADGVIVGVNLSTRGTAASTPWLTGVDTTNFQFRVNIATSTVYWEAYSVDQVE
jgi:hypothetical protein